MVVSLELDFNESVAWICMFVMELKLTSSNGVTPSSDIMLFVSKLEGVSFESNGNILVEGSTSENVISVEAPVFINCVVELNVNPVCSVDDEDDGITVSSVDVSDGDEFVCEACIKFVAFSVCSTDIGDGVMAITDGGDVDDDDDDDGDDDDDDDEEEEDDNDDDISVNVDADDNSCDDRYESVCEACIIFVVFSDCSTNVGDDDKECVDTSDAICVTEASDDNNDDMDGDSDFVNNGELLSGDDISVFDGSGANIMDDDGSIVNMELDDATDD
ncbi:hypothetical protein SNE40_008125 [Patella caerulea]|uniref:Uncharacterized protein n=1 Tax=Patella caerulea TaxID=87958 RepID=A0AAN8JZ39_PATCE